MASHSIFSGPRNHSEKTFKIETGAKLGRRFLKQPAEKLKAVFVAS